MGLTGFVLKDISAIIGQLGYTLKGLHKELSKGKQPTHFIRKARLSKVLVISVLLMSRRRKKLSRPWSWMVSRSTGLGNHGAEKSAGPKGEIEGYEATQDVEGKWCF